MSELRILAVGDIHLSDSAPGKRTETYTEDILAKCCEATEIAEREQATHMLLLGDVFDNKYAHRNSHRLVQEIGGILAYAGLPVLILVGNHDLPPGGDLDALSRQPLGTLGLLPNVTLLCDRPHALDDDVVLYPVPGVPLGENWRDAFVTRHWNESDDVKRRIVVAHQLIVPDVSVYPAEAQASFYDAKEVALATDADMVLYGDVHENHGAYKAHGVVFANFGSICRTSVKQFDHKPEVVLYIVEDDERRSVNLERFPLTFKPADEVYRIEEHFEAKDYKADIDEAVGRIKTTRIEKFSMDSIVEDIRVNSSVSDSVRDVTLELIEAVR